MSPNTVNTASRNLALDAGGKLLAILPGLALCLAVTGAAFALEHIEERLFDRAWLEALVLAILIGTAVRTAWAPGSAWRRGITFSAKTLLEVAVVLLGASLSAATIIAAGPGLLLGIAGIVTVAIALSYGIARALSLPRRLAILIACGNSICGNSAIAAVAPVIGADGDDVLNGSQGDDSLLGNDGMDSLFGGTGDDVLDGGVDDEALGRPTETTRRGSSSGGG